MYRVRPARPNPPDFVTDSTFVTPVDADRNHQDKHLPQLIDTNLRRLRSQNNMIYK